MDIMSNTRRCLFFLLLTNSFSSILLATSFSLPSTNTNDCVLDCVIQVCHNKDCCKKGGGEKLLNTFRDLLPAPSSSFPGEPNGGGVVVESSGCLSQCGKGPNVKVVVHKRDGKEEKMYFGVEDPTTASAVIDVATGEDYPIYLLVAATSIYEAKHATSLSKKEKLLTSAISAVDKDEDPTLQNSFAHAHALSLRADVRLDMTPPNIDGAIADAKLASQKSPSERRVWRVLASALEAGGRIDEAIDAISELVRVDPSFSTKSKKEIKRLSGLLCCTE